MAQVPDKDNLRNSDFNGLDWTDGNRLHKNAKRLGQTLPDEVRAKSAKSKIAIKCSKCGRKFKTVNGVLPQHTAYSYWFRSDLDPESRYKKNYCDGTANVIPKKEKEKKITQIEIKGVIYKVGDKVLVEKRASTGQLPTNVIPKRVVVEAIIDRFSVYAHRTDIHFIIDDKYVTDKYSKYHTTDVNEFIERGVDILKVE